MRVITIVGDSFEFGNISIQARRSREESKIRDGGIVNLGCPGSGIPGCKVEAQYVSIRPFLSNGSHLGLYSTEAAQEYTNKGNLVTRSTEFHCIPKLIFSFNGQPEQSLWEALNNRATLNLPD